MDSPLISETDPCLAGSQVSETIELQGRSWSAQQIEEIGQWVREKPTPSRYRVSRELWTRWS
jgi:hypothetical protein